MIPALFLSFVIAFTFTWTGSIPDPTNATGFTYDFTINTTWTLSVGPWSPCTGLLFSPSPIYSGLTTVSFSGLVDGSTYTSCEILATDPVFATGLVLLPTFTVDLTAPLVPTISTPISWTTLWSLPVMTTWTCETWATVNISNPLLLPDPTTWLCLSWTYNVGLFWTWAADWFHILTADQTDPAGNTSTSTWVTFNLDTTAPVLSGSWSIADPNNYTWINYDLTINETGTLTIGTWAPCSWLILTPTTIGSWTTTINISSMVDATYAWCQITATDVAGNPTAIVIPTWESDFTPPAAPTIFAPVSGTVLAAVPVTVTWTCETWATVNISNPSLVPDPTSGICSGSNYNIGLSWTWAADGLQLLTVYQRDPAGNVSVATWTTFTLDTTPPVVTGSWTIPDPNNLTWINYDLIINETGTLALGVWAPCTWLSFSPATIGSWTTTINFSGMADFTIYSCQFTVTDDVGNSTGFILPSWESDFTPMTVTGWVLRDPYPNPGPTLEVTVSEFWYVSLLWDCGAGTTISPSSVATGTTNLQFLWFNVGVYNTCRLLFRDPATNRTELLLPVPFTISSRWQGWSPTNTTTIVVSTPDEDPVEEEEVVEVVIEEETVTCDPLLVGDINDEYCICDRSAPSDQCLVSWLYAGGMTKFSNKDDFWLWQNILREEAAQFIAIFARSILNLNVDSAIAVDVSDLDQARPSLIESIKDSIKLWLFAWSEAGSQFLPKSFLTEAQWITITVKPVTGPLPRSEIWYQAYYAKASTFGLLNNDFTIGNADKNITREKFARLLYRLHLAVDAGTLTVK